MYNRALTLVALLLFAGVFVLTGCSRPFSAPGDTDGDGLSDDEETSVYLTNPRLPDTDGYSDGEEINTYQFNPDLNPHKFNPCIADVPKIGVTLQSLPAIVVHYTSSTGASTTKSTDWRTETATSRSKDRTTSQSKSVSYSVGVKVSAEQEFSTTGGKTTVSTELSYTHTSTSSNSTSFSVGQTQSKRDTYNECKAHEQSQDYTEASGELQTVVEIANVGDIAFTVKNLYLNATEFDPTAPDSLAPICGLNRDTETSTFQQFSLAPGSSYELHYAGDMDLGTAHKLLRDTQNLVIDVESYELVDGEGTPYVHNTTEIGTKTASIVVVYGPGITTSTGEQRVPGKYLVVTNADPNNPGISLASIMTDILRLSYEIGTVTCNGAQHTNLRSFDGVVADGSRSGETVGYWVVIHSYTRSGVDGTDWDTPDTAYHFADMTIHAGDIVLIFHTEDKDGDGLTARQELSWGTDDDNTNTDGDDSTHPAIPQAVSDSSVDRAGLPDGVTLFQHSDYEGTIEPLRRRKTVISPSSASRLWTEARTRTT